MDWFRYYVDTLDNKKIQSLRGLHQVWCNFMCLSRIYGGTLPDIETIAFRLRCSPAQAEKWRTELKDRKLIDHQDGVYVMHEWGHYQYQSDDSRERVRSFRQRQKKQPGNGQCNGQPAVTVTVQSQNTDTEQNRTTTTTPLQRAHLTTSEWPETTDAICGEFTATDDALLFQIINAAAQTWTDGTPGRDLTDKYLAEAVREARKQSPTQYNAALYITTVPKIIRNWIRQAKGGRRG